MDEREWLAERFLNDWLEALETASARHRRKALSVRLRTRVSSPSRLRPPCFSPTRSLLAARTPKPIEWARVAVERRLAVAAPETPAL
jgi:hypothetical protein